VAQPDASRDYYIFGEAAVIRVVMEHAAAEGRNISLFERNAVTG
jgi:hypothetical protein